MDWKLRRRPSRDRDLDEEIAFDLAAETEERIAAGLSREQAEAASRKDFGNVLLAKEVTRETWGLGWLERLLRDETTLVWCESPGSVTMEVQDVPAIVAAAHRRGAVVALDNTWAAGVFFDPFAHGVDVAMDAFRALGKDHGDRCPAQRPALRMHRRRRRGASRR